MSDGERHGLQKCATADGVKQTARAMGNISCVTETIDQCDHTILAQQRLRQ